MHYTYILPTIHNCCLDSAFATRRYTPTYAQALQGTYVGSLALFRVNNAKLKLKLNRHKVLIIKYSWSRFMNCSITHFPMWSQNNKAKRNNFC